MARKMHVVSRGIAPAIVAAALAVVALGCSGAAAGGNELPADVAGPIQ